MTMVLECSMISVHPRYVADQGLVSPNSSNRTPRQEPMRKRDNAMQCSACKLTDKDVFLLELVGRVICIDVAHQSVPDFTPQLLGVILIATLNDHLLLKSCWEIGCHHHASKVQRVIGVLCSCIRHICLHHAQLPTTVTEIEQN